MAHIYGVVDIRMSTCISSVDSRNHKMLHAYTQSVLHCLDARSDVAATRITVACYGAALQMHLPHSIALLGPNLSWELWTERGKFEPFFDVHLNQVVQRRTGSVDDFFADISAREERHFICLVDLDLHVQPHVLRSRNEKGVKPTVESENMFYQDITARYADVCRLASRSERIIGVSIPFRAPWLTEDFEANKAKATWVDKDEMMVYPKLQTFKQFCTRPRSTELRGLFLCRGADVEYEQVDWKTIDREMGEYNASRVFRDSNIFVDFVAHYKQLAMERKDLFANETVTGKTWRHEFLENSLKYVTCAVEEDGHAVETKAKRVRFNSSV